MVYAYIRDLVKELRKKNAFKVVGTNKIDQLWFYYKGYPFKILFEEQKPTKDMMFVHIRSELVVDEFKKPVSRSLIYPLYQTFTFQHLHDEILSMIDYLLSIQR